MKKARRDKQIQREMKRRREITPDEIKQALN
jgi:hypothetical protein